MHPADVLCIRRGERGRRGGATIPAMTSPFRYLPGASPLVLDSPHSGTAYPPDFGHACDLPVLRRAEDTHVEKLYDFALGMGAHWIEAFFPRSYLDVNRDTTESLRA